MELYVTIGSVVIAALTLIFTGQWERLKWLKGIWRTTPEVVIGVVVHDGKVLLVHRVPRIGSRLFWQFPSGTAPAGDDLKAKLKREIINETGISVVVRDEIGRRTHPWTGKFCVYFACDYVAGEPENRDPDENIDVRWVDARSLNAYMAGSMFRKVRAFVDRG